MIFLWSGNILVHISFAHFVFNRPCIYKCMQNSTIVTKEKKNVVRIQAN